MQRAFAGGLCSVWLAAAAAVAQNGPAAADAERRLLAEADARVAGWRQALRPFRPAWNWLADGLWFEDPNADGERFVRVDAAGGIRRAAKLEQLGLPAGPADLVPQVRGVRSSEGGAASQVTFVNRQPRTVRLFWVDSRGRSRPYGKVEPGSERQLSTFAGHVWLADFAADDLAGVFVANGAAGRAVLDDTARQVAMQATDDKPIAPPRAEVSVRDHQVVARWSDGEQVLTTDGTAADPYHAPEHWSPDGNKVLGFQVESGETRHIHLIESAPRDRLQPKLHTLDYRKPGDRIERPRPRLFDLAGRRQVPIDDAPFADAWSIDHVRWSADSATVYCLYNRRGHQLLQLLAIDAATGAVRVVTEERSATFVDYSQKTFLHWLADGRRCLWASERDGWNHLYLVELATGAAQQLTRGPWLVREVERVDERRGEVWLRAFGFHADQDPYHAHLVRVGLDGGPPVAITTADGSHEWTFSPDRQLVVVRWSRVDQPWVTELRAANDGRLLRELGRDDASAALAAGLLPPQRFVAPGRDGTTPIHGVITLPSTFRADRRYPVIEDIYAGPQDHFVPKRWDVDRRQHELAELGFVVVQIDGMGTNWRHKAFHDVCWRNLKDSGFPDRILWLREAAKTRPWLDLDRVGVFGGSAGGQSALAALLHHGDFYDVAVADCGCHDNRMDKIWWNEAWMGWPIGPWYADNANATHAAKLRGALLLTVGELDRNVDPASTMQVVKALIAADRDFDLLVGPGGGHGIGESPYFDRRRKQFFRRHLLGGS